MKTKKDIRKQIQRLRAQTSDDWIETASREITARVCALPEFLQAERILAYSDCKHEVMTRFLIEEAWKAGKETAVPKVAGKEMIFYRLTDFAQLKTGYYGIPEPMEGEGEIVQWERALMIMPGVAFDRMRHRVGYGGGFYDRYLSSHPALVTVAVAFDFQLLKQVPTEPTDILPQILVTESERY